MTPPAESILPAGDATFRVLMGALQVGVVLHGPDAELLYANPKASELLGLTDDQLRGRSSFHPDWHFCDADERRMAPEDYPAIRVMRTRVPVRDLVLGIYRPVTGDRVWVVVRADPQFDAIGELQQIVVSFSDITAMREADAARRHAIEAAERFRRALDEVPAYVYMKDRDSRYTYGNAQTLDLFGVTAEALVGSGDERFFPPEATARLRAIDRRVIRGEHTREEVVVERPDGTRQVYVEVKSPMMDLARPDRVVGILGISIDISELRRLEEQLQQAVRLESIGRLAGGVAHDFNNMLGVILGRAELAISHVPPGSVIHENLAEIVQAGRRSADLTRHLLAFARKQTVVPRRLALGSELERARQLLQRLLTEEIPLRWEADDDLWEIHLDPTQLDQVLVNLCVNARDAIRAARRGDGSSRRDAVTIRARNVTLDQAFCDRHGGAAPGAFVAVSVEDTGCGIAPADLPNVFEPFFTTKSVGEGTGLGLAIVFGTVRQAGGMVDVSSTPGHGARFTVYFPRYTPSRQSAAERVTPADGTPVVGGAETILITEDEPALLRLTGRSLARLGYRVLLAGSPAEALRLASEHQGTIDLLLTDVVMPEMSGRELADRFRAAHPSIRQLFMSGFPGGTPPGIEPGGDLGHFLAKPFTLSELAASVRQALDAAA
ncbi:MAG TPA: PAS domain-containing protein [Gemmatimonadales bacterium]|nr:PAS domain-containing protein [Gemmatimonadales bacterium]